MLFVVYRSVKRELHYQLGVTKRFLDSVFYPMLNSRYNYMGLRGCSHLDEVSCDQSTISSS